MQLFKMFLLCLIFLSLGCKQNLKNSKSVQTKVEVLQTDAYELHKILGSEYTLVLYPGGGTTSKQTKEEFDILATAEENGISVLLMNFNRHLWIDENRTEQLANELEKIFSDHKMVNQNVFIGGMSIGGNVSLTLSNYLCKNSSVLCPKGVFIIDSPIDLFDLYSSSLKDISNPIHSEERLAEPKWIVNYFEEEFGKEDSVLINISKVSPFTLELNKINVPDLINCELRFYTEPDAEWWMKNRQTSFENTNAYTIQKIAKKLDSENWKKFQLIETKNKGVRSNGDRHPHSWSIVNKDDLVTWIKE